ARTGQVASKNVKSSNLDERLKEMLNGYKIKFTIRLCFYLQEKIATYNYLIAILFTCTVPLSGSVRIWWFAVIT
ncbi:hypothetical protein BpHYR1_011781, partial [Brachionus plicatilis]